MLNYSGLIKEIPISLQEEASNTGKSSEEINVYQDLSEFVENHRAKITIPPFSFEPFEPVSATQPSTQNKPAESSIRSVITSISNSVPSSITAMLQTPPTTTTTPGSLTPSDSNSTIGQKKIPPQNGVFGVPLETIMEKQREKYPNVDVPIIVDILHQNMMKLHSHLTEGIFRVSPSQFELQANKICIDQGDYSRLEENTDPHLPAALLKAFLRELPDSLIPASLYYDVLIDPNNIHTIVTRSLPPINLIILDRIISNLQIFLLPESIALSRMSIENFATIFSPVLLRCPNLDPNILLANSPMERIAIKNLFKHFANVNNTPPTTTTTTTENSDSSNNNSNTNNNSDSVNTNNDNAQQEEATPATEVATTTENY